MCKKNVHIHSFDEHSNVIYANDKFNESTSHVYSNSCLLLFSLAHQLIRSVGVEIWCICFIHRMCTEKVTNLLNESTLEYRFTLFKGDRGQSNLTKYKLRKSRYLWIRTVRIKQGKKIPHRVQFAWTSSLSHMRWRSKT